MSRTTASASRLRPPPGGPKKAGGHKAVKSELLTPVERPGFPWNDQLHGAQRQWSPAAVRRRSSTRSTWSSASASSAAYGNKERDVRGLQQQSAPRAGSISGSRAPQVWAGATAKSRTTIPGASSMVWHSDHAPVPDTPGVPAQRLGVRKESDIHHTRKEDKDLGSEYMRQKTIERWSPSPDP